MKKLLIIIMTVLLTISVSMVNVFAESFSVETNGNLSDSGWNQEDYDSIIVGESVQLTVDCFAIVDSLTIGAGATVTIIPSENEEEPNGFMIIGDGTPTLTLGEGASLVATHDEEKCDGLLDLQNVNVSGIDLMRRIPGVPDGEQIDDDSPITGVFAYDNGLEKWFLSEEEFGPTDEFPYVIHYHCSQGGYIAITSPTVAEENISINGEDTTARFDNQTTSVVFTYTESDGYILDCIWIEQDGNDDDSRIVDFDNDERFDLESKTFTLDLTETKYDDNIYKFVNIDFNFREKEDGPAESQYVIRYDNQLGSVNDIEPNTNIDFTVDDEITWALAYPQDVENLYRVEINVLVDGGAHYEYEYGREEGNSEEIVVNDTEKTISYTPTTNDPFEVFIYWTPENFFDSFGYNDREEFQICADIISNDGEITYSEERRGGVRIDGENGYREKNNFAVQGQETEVENITLTIVPLNGKELKSFKVDGDEKDISKLSKNNDGLYEYIIAVDDLKEAIVDTSPTEYRYKSVYVEADFGNEEEPIPDNYYGVRFPNNTEIEGNVVTYSVQKDDDDFRDVTITIAGTEVDSINHRVLIPKDDLDSVTFTINYDDFGQKYKTDWDKFVRNFDLRISESNVSLPLTNRQTSLATISSDVDLPDALNLEVNYYKFPWYTISYGNSGNVQTEHGSVLVERIHCGENTFTNIDDEVNEGNKIYPMSMLTGGNADVESPDYDPENDTLAKYKLAYGTGDIFVELGTGDVLIDYKFVPEYGYQVTDIALNESDSILGDFDPNASTISEFTFTTEMNGNVHFLVKFEKTEDLADVDKATNIAGASIANGANATKTGNLALTIEDDETDTAIENAISTFDVTLDNVVSKGGENGIWTTNITEFDDPITVNLKLDTSEYDGDNYTVVREHDGFKEVLSGTTYNAKTGELTFQTNKFSKYTIVEIPMPNHGGGSSKYVIPKTGIR